MYKRKTSTLHAENEKVTRFTLDVKGKDTTVGVKNDSGLDNKKKQFDDNGWYYIGLFSQIGFSIALPIAGCAILGKMADGVWNSTPKWTFIGLGVGIAVSVVTFIHSIRIVLHDKRNN